MPKSCCKREGACARREGWGRPRRAPERRSPEYFAKFLADEIARWSGPIKASGVSAD